MAAADLGEVADYFNETFAKFGATAKGLDWNGEATQLLSMEQCCKLFGDKTAFSLIDLGCGYAPFLDYLRKRKYEPDYLGIDISEPMIEEARKRFSGDRRARFEVGALPTEEADFVVASGIFNLRFDRSDEDWRAYILRTLDAMNVAAVEGFAFNCLTKYSDADRMRPDLFYSDPCWLFDHCKQYYSRNVALLHDYEKYEFTIIVRR
ncbi:MAG: class I SAM-dependent methyltransferase [Alphaproteobacteria bacterium]|nr:class I SAM-dependent methyltransferase [Alphaproteobacteria bacterium]